MATILFPTDFSKTATNAFLYALNLAQVIQADIRLLTVKTHLKDYLEIHKDEFNQKVQELQQLAIDNEIEDVRITSSLEVGDFLITLLDVIQTENIEYIVMGTNGENSFGKKFFGSQTLDVIKNSPIPVLAVPHNVEFIDGRKFAYATMLDPKEMPAIREMQKYANRHHSKLDIIHINHKELNHDKMMIKRQFQLEFPDAKVEIVKHEDVERGLIEYCEMYKVDVLGMRYRDLNPFQRFFTESYSKYLLTNANFAILIVKV